MTSADISKHSKSVRHVLLTGLPGVGKTTLVKKLLNSSLLSGHFPICGFLTQEIRSPSGRRAGFDVVSLQGHPHSDNKTAPLARTRDAMPSMTLPAGPNVGNYVVDIKAFESLALQSMRPTQGEGRLVWPKGTLCILDEIGKMELLSGAFKRAAEEVTSQENTVVLATVPLMSKGKGLLLVEDLKSRSNVKLFEVTRENRENLVTDVATLLKSCLTG